MLRFLSSIRLAVILLATIAGLAVSATIYDMPELFRSVPFRGVVAVFFVNLLTCSVQLWPGLVRTLRRTARDIVGKEAGFRKTVCTEDELRERLSDAHYAVDEVETENGRYLYAVRGRLTLLAPHLLHIAILVIIIGALLSSFATKAQIQLAPGEVMALPQTITEHTGPLSLAVSSFETVYDEQGAVENWVTDFTLIGEKREEKAQTKVNSPYKSHGLSVYQMAYSNRYGVKMEGDDPEYNGEFEFPEDQKIPLPEGSMMFSAMTEHVVLFSLFDKDGNLVEQEGLREGASIEPVKGLHLTYDKPSAYTVLELKYSRAIPIVFAGFILATIACCLFWLGRFRAVAIHIPKEGACALLVRSKSAMVRETVYDALGVETMQKELL